jgi:transcriptional regulator with XRE-family HTH domain
MSGLFADEIRKLALGMKLRTLRERKGLGLDELARQTDIPAVVLSQIEQEVVSPTVAALVKLAHALDTSIDVLLQNAPFAEHIEVVRAGEGRHIRRRPSVERASLTYNYESLAYRLPGKHMEPFLVEFALDTDEPAVPLTHDGEEFLYILQGTVEFIAGDERVLLRQGDSIYFYSRAPHALRAVGTVTPQAIAVLYPYST